MEFMSPDPFMIETGVYKYQSQEGWSFGTDIYVIVLQQHSVVYWHSSRNAVCGKKEIHLLTMSPCWNQVAAKLDICVLSTRPLAGEIRPLISSSNEWRIWLKCLQHICSFIYFYSASLRFYHILGMSSALYLSKNLLSTPKPCCFCPFSSLQS